MGKKPLNYVLLLIIVLSSILIRGYSFGIGDQAIHLPLIYKLQDSSLYPNDYLFTVHQNDFSLFYIIIADLLKIFSDNIWQLFFVLYTVISVLTFLLIAEISKKLFRVNLCWFFALFFFIIPFHIGGSAIMSVEVLFVPRLIGNLLSLYIIYLILNKKFLLSFLVLGIEFLLHPLSAIPIGIVLLFIIISSKDIQRKKILFKGTCIFLLISGWFIVKNIPLLITPKIGFNNSEWLSVLKSRNSYAFPLLWTLKGWLSLLIGILPIIIYLAINRFLKKALGETEQFMYRLLIISMGTLLIQIVFTGLFPNPNIINLQLSRIFILPVTISFITLGYFVNMARVKIHLSTKNTIIIGVFLIILLALIKLPDSIKRQNQEWMNSQDWVNSHTSKECIFLVPFDSQGFRVYSKRTIVGEYKDGTLSFYSPEFARSWNGKKNDLEGWDKLSTQDLSKLQEKYHFSYLINNNLAFIPLEYIYKNSAYTVYEMPKIEKNCYLNKD